MSAIERMVDDIREKTIDWESIDSMVIASPRTLRLLAESQFYREDPYRLEWEDRRVSLVPFRRIQQHTVIVITARTVNDPEHHSMFLTWDDETLSDAWNELKNAQ